MGEALRKFPQQKEQNISLYNEGENSKQEIRKSFEDILEKAGINKIGFVSKGQSKKAETINHFSNIRQAILQGDISPEIQRQIQEISSNCKGVALILQNPDFDFTNKEQLTSLADFFAEKIKRNNPNERGFASIDVMSLPDHENNFDHHYLGNATEAKIKPCAANQIWQRRNDISKQGEDLPSKIITHKGADPDSMLATSLYLLLRSGEINNEAIDQDQKELIEQMVELVSFYDYGRTYELAKKLGNSYFDQVGMVKLFDNISNQVKSNELMYMASMEIIRRIIKDKLDPLSLNENDFQDIDFVDSEADVFKIIKSMFVNYDKLAKVNNFESRFSLATKDLKIGSGENIVIRKILKHLETATSEEIESLKKASVQEIYKTFESLLSKKTPNIKINIGKIIKDAKDTRGKNKKKYEEWKRSSDRNFEFWDSGKKAIHIKRFLVDAAEVYLDGYEVIIADSGDRGISVYFHPDFVKSNFHTLKELCFILNANEFTTGNRNKWELIDSGVIAPPSDRGKGEIKWQKGSNLPKEKILEIIKKVIDFKD